MLTHAVSARAACARPLPPNPPGAVSVHARTEREREGREASPRGYNGPFLFPVIRAASPLLWLLPRARTLAGLHACASVYSAPFRPLRGPPASGARARFRCRCTAFFAGSECSSRGATLSRAAGTCFYLPPGRAPLGVLGSFTQPSPRRSGYNSAPAERQSRRERVARAFVCLFREPPSNLVS